GHLVAVVGVSTEVHGVRPVEQQRRGSVAELLDERVVDDRLRADDDVDITSQRVDLLGVDALGAREHVAPPDRVEVDPAREVHGGRGYCVENGARNFVDPPLLVFADTMNQQSPGTFGSVAVVTETAAVSGSCLICASQSAASCARRLALASFLPCCGIPTP